MTKKQIRQLSQEELIKVSLKRSTKCHNRYTNEALYAQVLLWEESWLSITIKNEPAPFDYEPFSMED